MQVTVPSVRFRKLQIGWLLLATLAALLVIAVGADLWRSWMNDSSLSFAPIMPILSLFLLWRERDGLRNWEEASTPGLVMTCLFAPLYVCAVWADIEALKPLMLIGILAGGVQYLGGYRNLKVCMGALGLLFFTIPWPTTLIGKIQFPLQLFSSSYAGMFAGMLGFPVVREGVSLAVVPDPSLPPIYRIVVAQQCSGLTSLMVLLALGYLIAYRTPIRFWGRAALFLTTIPLALFANAVRLTIVLAAGANHGAAVAKWVHDHEQPVLVFFCTVGLIALRHSLLQVKALVLHENAELAQDLRSNLHRIWFRRVRITVINSLLLLTLVGGIWGRRAEGAETQSSNFLSDLNAPYRDWKSSDFKLTADETAMLQPDALLLKRYHDPKSQSSIEVAVIAGHRKKTIHTPDYCLTGGGWETLSQRDLLINLPDGYEVPAVRSWLAKDGKQMTATYFFTDGDFSTRSLPQFQVAQIAKRFRSSISLGALVRIIAPMRSSQENTEALSDDFARTTLPTILGRMKQVQRESNRQ